MKYIGLTFVFLLWAFVAIICAVVIIPLLVMIDEEITKSFYIDIPMKIIECFNK